MNTPQSDIKKALPDPAVRTQLLFLLHGGGAHINPDEAVANFPSPFHIGEFAILRQVIGTWAKT